MIITLTKNKESGEFDSYINHDAKPNVDTVINDTIDSEINTLVHKLSYSLKSIDFSSDLNITSATINIDKYTHTIKQEIDL